MIMFCCVSAMMIVGCSKQYEFSHKSSYINDPHLEIAPGLSGAKLGRDLYPIPAVRDGEAVVSKQPVSLLPPGSHIATYGSKRARR